MSLKAKVEAVIYAAEDPVTLDQIASLLRADVLADLAAAKTAAEAAEAEAATGEAAPEISTNGEISHELAADEEPAPEAGPLLEFNGESKDETLEEEPTPETPAETASVADQAEPVPDNTAAASSAVPSGETAAEALEAPEEARSEAPTETPATPEANPSPESATPAASASVQAPETSSRKRAPKKTEAEIAEDKAVRARLREVLAELITDCAGEERGIEVRQIAGGFRMATKPEHHDVVRAFAKSLKPPIRLSLAALETLAVVAYKQPITGPEITDIRGVESAGVIGTLLDRKLITTAGRKQVIGRPMQYKTSKEFLLRFGLNDINELPSMEEFSQLASDLTAVEIAPAETEPSLFENAPEAGENKSGEHDEDGEAASAGDEMAPEPIAAAADEAAPEATPADAPTEEPAEAPTQSKTQPAPEQEPAGRE